MNISVAVKRQQELLRPRAAGCFRPIVVLLAVHPVSCCDEYRDGTAIQYTCFQAAVELCAELT